MALDDWCDLDLAYLLLFDDHPDLHEPLRHSAGPKESERPQAASPVGDVRPFIP